MLLLPGYGVPTGRAAVPGLVDLAAALCERLDGPATLLGHSSSCQVVAHAARMCPDLVRRVVLVGPTTDLRARTWRALAAQWLRTAGHEDPRQVPALVQQYRRTGLRSMLATMDAARYDDIRATLTRIVCPVVVVRGAHDRIARSDWVRGLAASAPDGIAVELPRGAHMVPLTHPGLLAERLAPALAPH